MSIAQQKINVDLPSVLDINLLSPPAGVDGERYIISDSNTDNIKSIDATAGTIKIDGDVSSHYDSGNIIRVKDTGSSRLTDRSNISWQKVSSVVFSGGETTITIDTSYNSLSSNEGSVGSVRYAVGSWANIGPDFIVQYVSGSGWVAFRPVSGNIVETTDDYSEYRFNGRDWVGTDAGSGSGAQNFLQLDDVDESTYVNNKNKVPVVNDTENKLAFEDGGQTWLGYPTGGSFTTGKVGLTNQTKQVDAIDSLNAGLSQVDQDKVDKDVSAVIGNIPKYDSEGNLDDSGYSPSNFESSGAVTTHESAYTHSDIAQNKSDISDLENNKADKDTDAIVGNFAEFDINGNPVDSGLNDADFESSGTMATHESTYDHTDIATNKAHADTIIGNPHQISSDDTPNDSGVSGISVSDALDQLDTDKALRDSDAVAGNIAEFDSNGDPVDSGEITGNFLKHDGSVKMTGDLDMDENDIINVGNASISFKDGSKIVSSKFEANGDINISNITNNSSVTGVTTKDALEHLDSYKLETSLKGAVNGLAELGVDGKIPASQLPASVIGALEYKGMWDASVGSYPVAPETGWYYVISVAGVIDSIDYNPGDWVVYNGSTWDSVDNTERVTSVNGLIGDINVITSIIPNDSDVDGDNADDALNTLKNYITIMAGPQEDELSSTDLSLAGITTYSGYASDGTGHNFEIGILEAGDVLSSNLIRDDASWTLTSEYFDVPVYTSGPNKDKANSIVIPVLNDVEDPTDYKDLKELTIVEEGGAFTPFTIGKLTILMLERYNTLYVRCQVRLTLDTADLQKGLNKISIIQRIV